MTDSCLTVVHEDQDFPPFRDLRYSNLFTASPFAAAKPIFKATVPFALDFAEIDCGVPGTVAGTTGYEVLEAADLPIPLTEVTVNVYGVPFCRFVTRHGDVGQI